MRLTLHTDYALRILIQVGLNEGKLTTINNIAQSFEISKHHSCWPFPKGTGFFARHPLSSKSKRPDINTTAIA